MRQYADSTALAAYPGGGNVPTAEADPLLRTASRLVDVLLRCVAYPTDTDGYPTDANVAEALSDATCAIVAETYETGQLAPGATQQWQQVSIGSVSLGGRQAADGAVTVHGVTIPAAALLALGSVGTVRVVVT